MGERVAMNRRCYKSAIFLFVWGIRFIDTFSPLRFAAQLRFLALLGHDGQALRPYTGHSSILSRFYDRQNLARGGNRYTDWGNRFASSSPGKLFKKEKLKWRKFLIKIGG